MERKRDGLVFKPGDLIHGAPISSFGRIHREGLRPAIVVGGIECTDTPDEICFGMIPDYPFAADRYAKTGHKGPRLEVQRDAEEMFVLIVSRTALLDKYGSDLKAIGFHFSDPKHRKQADELYEFSSDRTRVNDVLIWKGVQHHAGYHDQVRLYASDLDRTKIKEDNGEWAELVVREHNVDRLLRLARDEGGGIIRTPVYNPRGELLLPSGADRKIYSLGEVAERRELVLAS